MLRVCGVALHPSDPLTHPVDEDVSWQSSGGVLQAAEAVHHPAVVEGQCDLCQTASCSTEQETLTVAAAASGFISFCWFVLHLGQTVPPNRRNLHVMNT